MRVRRFFGTRVLIIVILVTILAVTGLWVHLTLSSYVSATAQTLSSTSRQNSPQDVAMTQALAQQYMHAFLGQRYDIMWSLLHPQVQAMWPNEETFATFWKTRFQDYTLQGFTPGSVKALPYWVNPETMVRYDSVEELPISLQLVPKEMVQQQALVPPEDLHPEQVFQHLPFVVQHVPDQNSKAGRWYVLAGGPADPEAPILPPMTPVSKTVQVPILMYHHISAVPPQNVLDLSLTVTPARLGQQLDYLKVQGYSTITFNQLFNALYYDGPLPLKPVILTFDDGYADAYQFAFPLLQAHGFAGMFYIITGKVGWQGQMTWPQLGEMLAGGMQMGSHTIHHVDMGRVLLNSQEQAQQEVQLSQSTLQEHLGIPIQQFCYPSGEPFRHGSFALRQAVVALLAAQGYVGATTDPGRTGTEQGSQAPFALLRIRIDGRESLQGFMASLPW